jgi:hypothetical protein
MRRVLGIGALVAVGLFAVIQFVPYGHDHTNPPVTAEPRWDSTRTRTHARAACFDRHSNQTEWPWSTDVAPFSWSTQRDVDEGRSPLNFSEWDRTDPELDELGDAVRDGSMPPREYLLIHPGARLGDAERRALADGLEATLRVSPPSGTSSDAGARED